MGLIDRKSIYKLSNTGFSSIYVYSNLSCGQRQLLLGNNSLGKTTLLSNIFKNVYFKNNQDFNTIYPFFVIYNFIGNSRREYVFIKDLHKKLNKLNTFFFDSTSSTSPVLQYSSSYNLLKNINKLLLLGFDCFVALDSLDKQAKAFREVMLLIKRSPGREAYPGDIFYTHSNVLEKFGQFSKKFSLNSSTGLPVSKLLYKVSSDFINTNLISITDGQWFLLDKLSIKNKRPSISLDQSVSRIGSVSLSKTFKYLILHVKKLILDYFFIVLSKKLINVNTYKNELIYNFMYNCHFYSINSIFFVLFISTFNKSLQYCFFKNKNNLDKGLSILFSNKRILSIFCSLMSCETFSDKYKKSFEESKLSCLLYLNFKNIK